MWKRRCSNINSLTDCTLPNLGPLLVELAKDNSAEFYFVDGLVEQAAGEGIEGFYEGPYYGYFRCDYLLAQSDVDSLSKALKSSVFQESVAAAYDFIYSVIEEEGPFDGILGFSHGATLAFSFLIQHADKYPLDPPFALFRCAVFIAGLAPIGDDGKRLRFSEKQGPLLKLPTVHIAGKDDAMFQESLNLYRLCEEETATFVCHTKGHLIPRDQESTIAIAKAIKDLAGKMMII